MKVERVSWTRTCWRSSGSSKSSGRPVLASWLEVSAEPLGRALDAEALAVLVDEL
ncbi:hypothetical protein WMF26_36375 [Sorangium sp. So ce185]|uniref:hypothetical protein n=1 Tax=Sorangium sp. So ce185 TaxID=3133287 RepID=UPI003F630695